MGCTKLLATCVRSWILSSGWSEFRVYMYDGLLCIVFVASLTHAVAEGQSRCNCFHLMCFSFSSIACTSRAAPESRAQFYEHAKQTRASRVRHSYEVRRSSLRCLRRVASPK